MAAAPTIASGAIRKLLEYLPRYDLDPAEVCAAAGTRPDVADDRDARVPLSILHALWEAVVARRPRPDLALVGASTYQPGDYGLVGFVAASSATLGDGLDAVVRYARLWTDAPTLRLADDGVIDAIYQPPLPDRPGLRLATEATLAEILHGARVLTGQPDLRPRAVDLAHPAPPSTAAHDAFFGRPVSFAAARTALVFTRDQLATPLPGHDSQLVTFLRELATQALTRRAAPDDLLARVRAHIADRLPRAVPDLPAIARHLAVSERTLRRRLDDEGTSYRALLDATRAELAAAYVRDRRLPLSEVAFMLGFAEQSAFNRAYKRWTGTTPSAARRAG